MGSPDTGNWWPAATFPGGVSPCCRTGCHKPSMSATDKCAKRTVLVARLRAQRQRTVLPAVPSPTPWDRLQKTSGISKGEVPGLRPDKVWAKGRQAGWHF